MTALTLQLDDVAFPTPRPFLVGVANSGADTSSAATLSYPSGIALGTLMVAWITADQLAGSIGGFSGWTSYGEYLGTGYSPAVRLKLYSKVVTAGDISSPSTTATFAGGSSSRYYRSTILAYTNYSTYEARNGSFGTPSQSTYNSPSLVLTGPGTYITGFATANGGTWSPGAGNTQDANGITSGTASLLIQEQHFATSGSTGLIPASNTIAANAQGWVSTAFAIYDGPVDGFAFGRTMVVTDAEGLADTPTPQKVYAQTDNLGLTDSISIVATYSKTIIDDTGLADPMGMAVPSRTYNGDETQDGSRYYEADAVADKDVAPVPVPVDDPVGIATPVAPTLTALTTSPYVGHTLAAGTYSYKVSAYRYDYTQQTTLSPAATITISGSQKAIQVNITAVTGATGYLIWVLPPGATDYEIAGVA